MDEFVMTDQPECCRNCGVRTDFVQFDGHQLHTCPACEYEYELYDEDPSIDEAVLNIPAFLKDTKPVSDAVNHPAHYKNHPSGIECITITEWFNFCRGNAIKYIWRAGEKANEIEDLKKARWYLDREIARLEQEVSK